MEVEQKPPIDEEPMEDVDNEEFIIAEDKR